MRIREAVAVTHRGSRGHNEDAVLKLPRLPLYAVADGMGGPGAGDVAAGLALDLLKQSAEELGRLNAKVAAKRSASDRLALGRFVDQVLNGASREVQREAARLQRPGMATTLLLATVVRNYAYIAHIGDSRAYLLRDGRLSQLTEDHTIAELHFRRGRISREEYESSPDRRLLYQVLGAGIEVDGDLAEVRLTGDDVLLLCSDGLPRALTDDEIARCIAPADLKGSTNRLVETALAAGAPDNVSVVLLGFEAEEGDEPIEAVTGVLKDVYLFRDMSQPELLTLAPYLEELVWEKSSTVLSEGDPCDAFYVVVSGTIRVTRGRAHVADVKAGGSFGELFVARTPDRGMGARTLTDVRAFVLTRDRFLELLRHKPELGARVSFALLEAVGDRVRDLGDRLNAVERAVRGELK